MICVHDILEMAELQKWRKMGAWEKEVAEERPGGPSRDGSVLLLPILTGHTRVCARG